MKIVFFSIVRYPTEKAYGVTIGYTHQALVELGHEALIKTVDDVIYSINKPLRFLFYSADKFLKTQSRSNLFTKFIFTLKRLLVAITSLKVIPSDTELLWVRDSLVGILYSHRYQTKKIVLELHQNINFIESYLLKKIHLNENVYLAPISRELENKLIGMQMNPIRIIPSPMAVPNAFFSKKVDLDLYSLSKGEMNIGYIGSALSLGLHQNLFSLINCIQQISDNSKEISPRLYIFGIEPEIIEIINKNFHGSISSGILMIFQRQKHDELIQNLDVCNIFILPYPENKYFRVRFPIKAMEYAALRRPVVISNTISHNNIFSNEEAWFFDPDKCGGLEEVLLKIYRSPNEVIDKVKNAYEKSLDHTYRNRALNIISRLQADKKWESQ